MTTKQKLTDKQKEIILYMKNGAEIYYSEGLNSSAGFSGGGPLLSRATFYKLRNLGIIAVSKESTTSLLTYYKLTKKGKTLSIEPAKKD